MQPSLVPLGVSGTCTLSGKTGITRTALFAAPASVVPALKRPLMPTSLADVGRSLLLVSAMMGVAAGLLLILLKLLVMVSLAPPHLSA